MFYVFCACKSSGYLQEDEHYQIIEFANYKLGLVTENKLAWEFEAQVRSGFQPFICYVIFKVANLFGVNDGYDRAFLLRAITGLLSIYVITAFISSYKKYIAPSLKGIFVIISFLLWFLPYLNIRFTSENLSGLMVILSLSIFEKAGYGEDRKLTFVTGLALGGAALFRYQIMLAIAGLVFWLLFVKKTKHVKILNLFAGIISMLLLGILIDHWLYNEWTITALNYFDANIIKGVASNFGTEPFYQYLVYVVRAPGVLGIFILASFIFVVCFYPKNLIVWMCVPFLFVHSIIPHKELRFLFPLINLCPFILIIAYQKAIHLLYKNSYNKKLKLGFTVLVGCAFLVINMSGLYAISTTSAASGKFSIADYIHHRYNKEHIEIIVVGGAFPFIDWGTIQNSYYSSKGYHIDRAVNIWQQGIFNRNNELNKKQILLIKANEVAGPKELEYLRSLGFKKVYQNIPELTLFIYNFYNPDLKAQQTYLFEKKLEYSTRQ